MGMAQPTERERTWCGSTGVGERKVAELPSCEVVMSPRLLKNPVSVACMVEQAARPITVTNSISIFFIPFL
jgi:hypothetical protein